MTAAHVAETANSVTVSFLGKPSVQASVVAINSAYDLALLYLDRDVDVIPIVFRGLPSVELGESVVVFGYSTSSTGNLTVGNVTGLTGIDNDLSKFQFSAEIQPGSSGSPVFDSAGLVMGIALSSLDDSVYQLVNLATRGTIILTFLDANDVDYHIADSATELEVTEVVATIREAVAKVSHSQVQ